MTVRYCPMMMAPSRTSLAKMVAMAMLKRVSSVSPSLLERKREIMMNDAKKVDVWI